MRARTTDPDSSHSLDAMNPHVIHLIDGVWQPCDDSPSPASCSDLNITKCSTLWAIHFRIFVQIFPIQCVRGHVAQVELNRKARGCKLLYAKGLGCHLNAPSTCAKWRKWTEGRCGWSGGQVIALRWPSHSSQPAKRLAGPLIPWLPIKKPSARFQWQAAKEIGGVLG